MHEPPPSIDELFHEALDRPEAEREPFLARRTADVVVLAEVRSLLAAHRRASGFLDTATPDPVLGCTLGGWRIEREIGSGGMGRVYLGERSGEGYVQRAAIKLIKRGMDTDAMLERFRRERRLLAGLEHPGIARLLDGGASPDGRPWLAMEFVEDGRPIDAYADEVGLPLTQRIELFVQACHAVHAAHQKLVVHRDLKPGNLLVTPDGRVKLLDFGIARLLRGDDTPADAAPATELTAPQERLLTPTYASPEQLAGRAVTTASDVYALGVLLYRLLTGQLPWPDGRRDEATRPERPTTRLAAIDTAELSRTAERRLTTPGGLRRALRGDLERIAMKAMAADPAARYASAASLAADLDRFLQHEPVEAAPGGVLYRSAKFARRHPVGTGFGVAAAVCLVAGVAILSAALVVVDRARDAESSALEQARIEQASSEAVASYLADLLSSPDPWRVGEQAENRRDVRVIDVVNRHAERLDAEPLSDPAVEASIRRIIGRTATALGDFEAGERHLRRAIALDAAERGSEHPFTLTSKLLLATALKERGRYPEAESLLREVVDGRTRLNGLDDDDTQIARNNLAVLLWETGRLDEAEPLARESLAWRRVNLPSTHRDVLRAISNLALILDDRGESEEAEQLFREELDVSRSVFPEDHPQLLLAMNNLARCLHGQEQYDEAGRLLEASLAAARETLGEEHQQTLTTMGNLGAIREAQERFTEALLLYEQVLAVRERQFGATSPRLGVTLTNLGNLSRKAGELERSRELYERSLAVHERAYGPEFWALGVVRCGLGATLRELGLPAEAETQLVEAIRLLETNGRGESHFMERAQAELALVRSGS